MFRRNLLRQKGFTWKQKLKGFSISIQTIQEILIPRRALRSAKCELDGQSQCVYTSWNSEQEEQEDGGKNNMLTVM